MSRTLLAKILDVETEAAEAVRAEEREAETAGLPVRPLPDGVRRRPVREDTLTIRLNTVVKTALERRAAVLGTTASALVRDLIEAELNQEQGESVRTSMYELVRAVERLQRHLLERGYPDAAPQEDDADG